MAPNAGFYAYLTRGTLNTLHGLAVQDIILRSSNVTRCTHSHTTSENMATWRRRQDLTSLSCTSNTSHCFALKNVEGPTGGPSSGETTILRLPPTCIPLMPSSNPAGHAPSTWLAVHDLTACLTILEVGLHGHHDCPSVCCMQTTLDTTATYAAPEACAQSAALGLPNRPHLDLTYPLQSSTWQLRKEAVTASPT